MSLRYHSNTSARLNSFIQTRNKTLKLIENLNEEDAYIQSMPDVSHIKSGIALILIVLFFCSI